MDVGTHPNAEAATTGATPHSPLPLHPWTLIYDGDCAFCRRCVALLARWDRHSRVRAVPFQEEEGLVGLPPIPLQALGQAMHLATPDGAVLLGAAAAPAILRLLPGGIPLAWAFAVPGVERLAAAVYGVVARNRHRLGCGSATCTRGHPG